MTEKGLIGKIAAGFVRLLCLAMFAATVAGCVDKGNGQFQGYIEGDYVYVSSPVGGRLDRIHIGKGAVVEPGALVYELEPEPERFALKEAASFYNSVVAQHSDKTKGLRPTEISAMESTLDRAEAKLRLSEKELQRKESLYASGAIAEEVLDAAKTAYLADRASVEEIGQMLRTARSGARADLVDAARKEVERARAQLDKAQWNLGQKAGRAPAEARVVDVLYHVGEYVPPGYPVVVLLPHDNVKARFFVPEPSLATLKPGTPVKVTMDGREGDIEARVSYVSPRAEYTPPFLYSRDNRSKLVFMVEAVFDAEASRGLNPGQPIEVRP